MTLTAISSSIDVQNMPACINDIRFAEQDQGSDPNINFFIQYKGKFRELLVDLVIANQGLPPKYQENLVNPFFRHLKTMGANNFDQLCEIGLDYYGNPTLNSGQTIISDMALAILLTRNENDPSKAFEEVVSDLFDGFLCDEDRINAGVNPPDRGAIAPLVKWGNPSAGPYTWPVDTTLRFGIKVPIVSLPPAYAKRGVMAWAALGHETGGHDILHADTGLLDELAQKVYSKVNGILNSPILANYWSACIDETASDVLGILNMGPAAGIGVIAFFRGLFADGKLRKKGSWNDPHPVDILRGYLAGYVVKQLKFSNPLRDRWAELIINQTDDDLDWDKIGINANEENDGFTIGAIEARKSAELVAQVISQTPLETLGNKSLSQIQTWSDRDEAIAQNIAIAIKSGAPLPDSVTGPCYYAAHVVAGATYAALSKGTNVERVHKKMVEYLVAMNKDNPTWAAPARPLTLASFALRRAVVYNIS